MVDHKIQSEDGQQQQTAYASGTKVRIRLPDPNNPLDPGELEVS
jgi:hypothetical protein